MLSVRRHGESKAIIEVFTARHGRHAGVVLGGASRKLAAVLQPGAQLDVSWRARLDDQLGTYTVELIRARAGLVLADRLALAALGAVTALCRFALPERLPYPGFYAQTEALADALCAPGWARAYALWELALLEETGFGLDLAQCAVTGATEGLAYVSPRTGRAVTVEAAGAYSARLLQLPQTLRDASVPLDAASFRQALHLSGYFLHERLGTAQGKPLPEARARLLAVLD